MDPFHGKRLRHFLRRRCVLLLLEAPPGGEREGPGRDPVLRPAAPAARGWKTFPRRHGVRGRRPGGRAVGDVGRFCGLLHCLEGIFASRSTAVVVLPDELVGGRASPGRAQG
ncbi:unnamed protein product, partial [Ectocarpus sp. 12 AP-2014]